MDILLVEMDRALDLAELDKVEQHLDSRLVEVDTRFESDRDTSKNLQKEEMQ